MGLVRKIIAPLLITTGIIIIGTGIVKGTHHTNQKEQRIYQQYPQLQEADEIAEQIRKLNNNHNSKNLLEDIFQNPELQKKYRQLINKNNEYENDPVIQKARQELIQAKKLPAYYHAMMFSGLITNLIGACYAWKEFFSDYIIKNKERLDRKARQTKESDPILS